MTTLTSPKLFKIPVVYILGVLDIAFVCVLFADYCTLLHCTQLHTPINKICELTFTELFEYRKIYGVSLYTILANLNVCYMVNILQNILSVKDPLAYYETVVILTVLRLQYEYVALAYTQNKYQHYTPITIKMALFLHMYITALVILLVRHFVLYCYKKCRGRNNTDTVLKWTTHSAPLVQCCKTEIDDDCMNGRHSPNTSNCNC
ncbi:MAG: hypothetical protein Faunusvirus18_15 [Faunusvirus sp.]|jgi:hypothetical protein|uniref:Uncharacterized protein n=1 Tax=Faunusvirus sp. TaxID=2487766 RepID=A0A3G4ZXD4_9VIRU|nr:MAG: hypothetical protein Faunusvirus18_15 [Faunusvirus sp.]